MRSKDPSWWNFSKCIRSRRVTCCRLGRPRPDRARPPRPHPNYCRNSSQWRSLISLRQSRLWWRACHRCTPASAVRWTRLSSPWCTSLADGRPSPACRSAITWAARAAWLLSTATRAPAWWRRRPGSTRRAWWVSSRPCPRQPWHTTWWVISRVACGRSSSSKCR